MDNPSPTLKAYTLAILDQLDLFLDYVILYADKNSPMDEKTKHHIMAGQLPLTGLKQPTDLYVVAQFLRVNGFDFDVPFDLVNDDPFAYINDEGKVTEDVDIATLVGEPHELKEKIDKLRNGLNGTQTKKIPIKNSNIVLDYDTCVLKIGDTEIKFRPESSECMFVRIISEQEPHQGLEWDEIRDKMEISNKSVGDEKRYIGDTRDRVNSKIQKELHTSEIFIERKNNRYTINQKIRRQ